MRSQMSETQETKACPWCGETILAVAKKCKHCGEYLTDERPQPVGTDTQAPSALIDVKCDYCGTEQQMLSDAVSFKCTGCQRTIFVIGCPYCSYINHVDSALTLWDCTQCGHRLRTTQAVRRMAAGAPYTGELGARENLSEVGDHTADGILKCPRCGGTEFTAKRSGKEMAARFAHLGTVGALAAPKSQVKCVACGLMFKRG